MRIYIDEAGNFVAQAPGQSLFSLVFALVVPSLIEGKLFDEFSSLLSSWPLHEAEIKGSKLDESQASGNGFSVCTLISSGTPNLGKVPNFFRGGTWKSPLLF
jgi:hypothetical protein